jgi:hypothetical protein
LVFKAEAITGGERYRGKVRSRLVGRAVTGPLAFLLAGTIDVSLLWMQWGAKTAAARLARRFAR